VGSSWAKGTKKRIALTTVGISVVMAFVTIAFDGAGGHPARSPPVTLTVAWFVLLFPIRLLIAAGRRRRGRHRGQRVKAAAAPEGDDGG